MNSRIALGIVGLGSDWTEVMHPHVSQIPRVRLVGLYDASYMRTAAVSRSQQIPGFGSVRKLIRQREVRALLCCGLGWQRRLILEAAIESATPVLLSSAATHELDGELGVLAERAAESGVIVCPDLSWRYTPATIRLRELMATQLGKCVEIRITLSLANPMLLKSMVDWCRAVVSPKACRKVSRVRDTIYLDFDACSAQIRVTDSALNEPNPAPDAGDPEWTVQCERGVAILRGERVIEWTVGEESRQETLRDDRSRIQVLLDLFFRRVVGGLVPTPSLEDLRIADELCHQVR
jgi:hypothetical protein